MTLNQFTHRCLSIGIIAIVILVSNLATAQIFPPRNIKLVSKEDDNFTNSFAVFSSVNPAIADKINRLVQNDQLHQLITKGMADSTVFEQVGGAMDYGIDAYTENFLTVHFTRTTLGMRFISTDTYYTFDMHTGEVVTLQSFFTAQGLKQLQQEFLADWKARLKKHEGANDEYSDCIDQAKDLQQLNVNSFIVKADGFVFDNGSCVDPQFPGTDSKAHIERSYSQSMSLISPYGQSLLKKPNGDVFFNRVLKGTISKYPITVYLSAPDASGKFTGKEVYDNVGVPIALQGTYDAATKKIVFHEVGDDQKPVSNLEATWDGKSLTGTFINLKTKKTLPLTVAPL